MPTQHENVVRRRALSGRLDESPRKPPGSAPGRCAVVRADLHVHSAASSAPVVAALGPLGCPESYSAPERVYETARRAGMDLVTITDHDTIEGAISLVERGFESVIVGEEVTVHFPEDRCKLHVLVWGITPEQHEELAAHNLRDDVYAFAHWLRERNLAHALAHPLYIQNHRLTLWHLERSALLFKGFEILNGAHAGSHRDALEGWLAALTPGRIQRLKKKHGLDPVWSRIWVKALTAGSDDHALLNVGKTWTSVPAADLEHETGPDGQGAAFLRLVMAGRAEVGGQAGHSALLAHQLMTVGMNYYAERIHDRLPPRRREIGARIVRFAGISAPRPSKAGLVLDVARRRLRAPFRRSGAARSLPVVDALRHCIGGVLAHHPQVLSAVRSALDSPAMADHDRMAAFTDDLSEALAAAMASGAVASARRADKLGIVDALLSYACVAALEAPHVFSLFHQNKERPLISAIQRDAGHPGPQADTLKVMLFTDTLGDVNGVCRFIQNMGDQAARAGRQLRLMTSTRLPLPERDHIHNFKPLFARQMPGYETLEVALPPLMRMLRAADAFQPDVIHVSTPGPVGLIGLLAARMLRCPVLGVYHTDFPAYIDHLFDDPTYSRITSEYMRFFYRRFAGIFSRSEDYMRSLESLGLSRERMVRLTPGIALETFRADCRDTSYWPAAGAREETIKLLYAGRISVEKNLPLLTDLWPKIRRAAKDAGKDVELIVAGDGPYRAEMERKLAGQSGEGGACFLGFKHGAELSTIYASSDLFIFPSLTDTLGQVVLESQSSGLPVLVSDQGGPKEVVDEGITGFILPGDKPAAWLEAAVRLITDDDLRRRMGRSAQTRSQRYTISATFEHFWQQHLAAAREAWLAAGAEGDSGEGSEAARAKRDRIDDEEPAAAG